MLVGRWSSGEEMRKPFQWEGVKDGKEVKRKNSNRPAGDATDEMPTLLQKSGGGKEGEGKISYPHLRGVAQEKKSSTERSNRCGGDRGSGGIFLKRKTFSESWKGGSLAQRNRLTVPYMEKMQSSL